MLNIETGILVYAIYLQIMQSEQLLNQAETFQLPSICTSDKRMKSMEENSTDQTASLTIPFDSTAKNKWLL